jgi:ABC-type transporter lipoprotein component MlaA
LAIDPTNFIPMKQHIWWAAGRAYFTILDLRSQNYQTLQDIQRTSIDYHSSLRSFYRQYRNQQIGSGGRADQPAELDDF